MCDKALRKGCLSLLVVSDWFVTQEQIDLSDDGKDKFIDYF